MPDLISIPLTPGQLTEFAAIARDEQAAQQTIREAPIARTFAARAIILGSYPHAAFEGKVLNVDLQAGRLTFAPNAAPLALVADEATG